MLDFYGEISSVRASPITEVPRVDGELRPFTVERTTELLHAAKKSDSRVDGNPLAFDISVSAIYNEINN